MVKVAPTQNPIEISDEVYDDGCLRVEHKNYYVTCKDKIIQMTATDFRLFSRLARFPERTVSSEDLWRAGWGESKPFNVGSLKVHMYTLRSTLAQYGIRIECLVNVGYRLSLRQCCSEKSNKN